MLDGRSDLFAVGVMLWEMMCGASLFGRHSLQATLKAVLLDPIPSPRSRRRDIPRDVERVTMTLLARRPEDRYRNADAAIAAIAAIAACGAFPRRAFPDDGPEPLSRVLVERLPDRALRRRAGHAAPLERPALSRGSAGAALGADPEETAAAPAAPPRLPGRATHGIEEHRRPITWPHPNPPSGPYRTYTRKIATGFEWIGIRVIDLHGSSWK